MCNNGILAMRRSETLPFVTTWMDFAGIALSEAIRQRRIKAL